MMVMPLFYANKEARVELPEGGFKLTSKASEEEIQSFYDYYSELQPEITKEELDELAREALDAHPGFTPQYSVPTESEIEERKEKFL